MKLTDVMDETEVAHTLHRDEFIENYLVEVKLINNTTPAQVVETLRRMGIRAANNTLSQTAHMLTSRGRYYLGHFKMFLQMEGHASTLTMKDIRLFATVIRDLKAWGKIELVDPHVVDVEPHLDGYKVIKREDAPKWNLKANYTFKKREFKNENSTEERLPVDSTFNRGKQDGRRDSVGTQGRNQDTVNRGNRGNGRGKQFQSGRESGVRARCDRV